MSATAPVVLNPAKRSPTDDMLGRSWAGPMPRPNTKLPLLARPVAAESLASLGGNAAGASSSIETVLEGRIRLVGEGEERKSDCAVPHGGSSEARASESGGEDEVWKAEDRPEKVEERRWISRGWTSRDDVRRWWPDMSSVDAGQRGCRRLTRQGRAPSTKACSGNGHDPAAESSWWARANSAITGPRASDSGKRKTKATLPVPLSRRVHGLGDGFAISLGS